MAWVWAWMELTSCLLNKSHILMIPSPYEAANFPFSRKERERISNVDSDADKIS